MSNGDRERRDTRALEPTIVRDPVELARVEARNGLRQYDAGVATAIAAVERGNFKLRPSTIMALHREALAGISSYAGIYRPGAVEIGKSKHRPPAEHLVPALMEEMCDHVNDHWSATPIHLASYVMWRLNWIHPFADGNGRTSRITSYVVLTIRAGQQLPGTPTIPDQIVENRDPYCKALEAPDSAFAEGRIDVSAMEALIESLLAKQLTCFYESVGGRIPVPRQGTTQAT